MMLKHLSNGYVAKEMINSSLPKVKNDEQAAQQFKNGFNLSRNAMRVAGFFELIGSIFLLMSVFGKKFVRIGTVMINIILGVAIFKHLKAGHGLKGSKSALKFFGLNTVNFMETLRK
ncbi:DoxX family protein [Virgibacillus sp. NKC19-3]|uniref:hypothetical protein n=1 Tax=Virgibacillus saliphilus TaxID=2831674 RepID=UPI001C9AACE4|nr:hypothetical protein [Virgibacillus sp. NKC19-3]MBY7144920.1 DoxX family protein [Virgibacillus sp. NKC19-3]